MSQLFDALRQHRRESPPLAHVQRTARADAVLATLGYATKRRTSPFHQPAIVGVCAIVAAVAIAWALWPGEATRSQPTTQSAGSKTTTAPVRAPLAPAPAPAPLPSATKATAATTDKPVPSPAPPAPSPALEKPRPSPASTVAATTAKEPGATAVSTTTAAPATPSPELFRLALHSHRAGDYATAEASYRALLQRNELDPQVHNNLGLLYRDKGQTAEAIRELQRAVIINPDYGTARNNLGVVLMSAARLDEAASELRRVLAQDPRNADAAVNLALVDKAAGRPEQAKEALLRALTIAPDNAPAHFNLAALYEQSGDYARAIEHYRSFLEYAGAEHASRTTDARARLEALARPR